MKPAGYSGTPLIKKLGIKAGMRIYIQGEPEDYATTLGPLPADSLFHAEARERFDAALCMYHDQALIPLKTISFDSGVNITLGLPFVRTSPDHGTAFDIVGTGRADDGNLRLAVREAARRAPDYSPVEVPPAASLRSRA